MDILIRVAAYVIEQDKVNMTAIMKEFSLGQDKAYEIIETLEKSGVISPVQSFKGKQIYTKPRKVLAKDLNHIKELLTKNKNNEQTRRI